MPDRKANEHGGINHSTSMELGPADAEFDLRFIDAIPHHQGAVEMAKEAQQKSKRLKFRSWRLTSSRHKTKKLTR